jgi:putative ABC transport system permease protein
MNRARESGDEDILSLKDIKIYMNTPPVFCSQNSAFDRRFRSGALTLARGRHVAPDDVGVVMVSERLAANNGLSPGDEIVINANDYMLVGDEVEHIIGDAIYAEIIGTFNVEGLQTVDEGTRESYIAENWFFADLTVCRALSGYIEHPDVMSYDSVSFFVGGRSGLAEAVQSVRGLDSINGFFDVTEEDAEYDETQKKLDAAKLTANIAAIALPGGFAIALFAVLAVFFKKRGEEFFVCFNKGVGKRALFGRALAEEAIVFAAAFALAVGLAAVLTRFSGDIFIALFKILPETVNGFVEPPAITEPPLVHETLDAGTTARSVTLSAAIYAISMFTATATAFLLFVKRPPITRWNARRRRKR